ncbi:adhesive plaque matrix protein-like [Portunus trituberculatus]|uniref:Uncharacterized protein n=1 Tax=Portunus trituberculatus TaxID=210409 RepID=A0A5B7DG19_PORTR|nr:adhesive plaque matrix protein-like [Portunus trituberculatus]MPC20421.1 hypothetical protein [Portunus trituberculatus]
MVSRCVSVAVAVLVVVAAVTAEPGFIKIKGRCRPHVRYVPYYKTIVNKIPVYHTVYKEKVVPSPIHKTVYKTQYEPQYQTKYVPKYVTKSVYNTDVEYITKYDVKYQTKYETKYVPQYKTVVKTEHTYKTVCPKTPYNPSY